MSKSSMFAKLQGRLVFALGFGLLTVGCAATDPAQDAAAVGADGTQTVAAVSEERICREEIRTGTNFKRRVCRTQAQWDAISTNQRRNSDEYSRQSSERSGVMGNTGVTTMQDAVGGAR
jgi:hypothetical protein